MGKARLIVASARLPVTMAHRQGSWEVSPSTGGLVTALKAVADRRGFTWLGWPGTHVPEGDRPTVARELKKHGSVPVYISKTDIEGFYQSFSNEVLWPLFHNLPERSHFDLSGWKSYQKVNEMFANAIAETAKPGDLVWIHDYQLALVPELVRRRVHCPIGFFLHIPFPSAETYRTLPVREEILRGMLGADLLGFHAYEYVSHFRNACLRVLGAESEPEAIRLMSRRVSLGVLPIGIDPGEIDEMAKGHPARQELASLQSTYAGKKLIVGVDRLDYTKGIPQKLRAFGELLRAYPRWRQRAVLIQVAAPSRTGVPEYQHLKREVDELVGDINGSYGSSASTPVVYINQSVPRDRLVGLYQAADVALITPVRDGMNLVALEYVAARTNQGGTLILSEFTGAAHCLPGARLVNPHNTEQVAEVLADSLEARAPNAEAFQHMLRFVRDNTSMSWALKFLNRLEEMATEARPVAELLKVDESPLCDRVLRSKKRLVLLDYDGTLRSYVMDPRDAVPDQRILAALRDLSERATVYIISGRGADVLEGWLGHLNIGLVCEHGLAVRHPGGEWEQRANVSGAGIKRLVEPVFQDFVQRTPGSAIEYKKAAIAWHYRAADPEYGNFQAKGLLTLLEDTLKRRPYAVLRGNRVIEVRHQKITKGQAVSQLLKRYGKSDLLFCAGDDRTDEEMMEAIPSTWNNKAITCWVGMRNAQAKYWVESNRALLEQLEKMVELWSSNGKKTKKPARRGANGAKTGRSKR